MIQQAEDRAKLDRLRLATGGAAPEGYEMIGYHCKDEPVDLFAAVEGFDDEIPFESPSQHANKLMIKSETDATNTITTKASSSSMMTPAGGGGGVKIEAPPFTP
jgi:hypothetical protein